ncbi:hypothetical protein LCGC14_0593360 [marine sediment metagenome]|uniref:Uncharacterized protein n=1 Tax=marine sediment metagenome TaxID=412755 RepID=A0A0F9ULB0_9ZZZZ
MEGKVNLSEATLYALGDKTMDKSEAEEILDGIMDLINGPDAPDDTVCFDVQFLPTVILEVLERISEYEDKLEQIREQTY